jgi:methionyl-tRNA synthetase
MNLSVQITAALAHACAPFLPFTGEKLKGMLNLHKVDLDWEKLLLEDRPYLEQGHQLGEIELLFSKINDKKDDSRKRLIESQKQKLMELVEMDNNKTEAFKEDCSFDDFQKVDLRVVEIKAAEKIPKANKLLKLMVDTGSEQKVVVSGIAKHYEADEIIGKKVLMIVNLKPRKVMGILSNGMILMTEDKEGRLVFMQPEENVPNGAMIQ